MEEHKHKELCCSLVPPPSTPKYPCFVAQNLEAEEDDTEVRVVYSLNNPLCHYRCKIPELLGKRIRGSFQGCWVLLSSNHLHEVMFSLWNPFTSQIIALPPLICNGSEVDNDPITSCCLSAPPDHPNSVFLLTRFKKQNFVYCLLRSDSSNSNPRKRNELRWMEMTYAKQLRSITGSDCSLQSLTSCNGKFYGYSNISSRVFVIVELNMMVKYCQTKKSWEVAITLLPILEYQVPNLIECDRGLLFLKGSPMELFTVVIGYKHKACTKVSTVVLSKLDMNNKTWDEVDDLKDTILSFELAADSSPLFQSPVITSSELGGYIHILGDKGKTIYSYHVKEKTLFLSSVPCLVGTSDVLAWAVLECPRLEGDDVLINQAKDTDDEIVVRSVNRDYEVEVNSTKDISHLLNIPFHVLEMVMEYCVGVEYLKFRSTCKICHLAAPLIQWGDGKASKRLQKCSLLSPWLIVFDKDKGIITFTDPLFGDRYFMKTPQELICKKSEIKCSRYGWLLILKHVGASMVFYNPFTSDIRELPRICTTKRYCFSAPPTSPDCMVVGLSEIAVYIHFVAGEPSWRRVALDGLCSYRSSTLYGQDLYAISDDGGLAVFKEIRREVQFWERNVAQAPSCSASFPESFQVRCDGHLLQVMVGKFGESVEVFKLNDTAQEWEKIDGLGKHMIFVSRPSSFCIEAKVREMENRIYFPRFSSENGNMVFYSLETCRYHTFNNKNIQQEFADFFGTNQLLTPHSWIEPSWS